MHVSRFLTLGTTALGLLAFASLAFTTQGCSSSAPSVADYCKAKVACEGGDQKTCEDKMNAQASAVSANCKAKYDDSFQCAATSASCQTVGTAKSYTTSDLSCVTKAFELLGCK